MEEMKIATSLAYLAYLKGEVPVGAVIEKNGKIIKAYLAKAVRSVAEIACNINLTARHNTNRAQRTTEPDGDGSFRAR